MTAGRDVIAVVALFPAGYSHAKQPGSLRSRAAPRALLPLPEDSRSRHLVHVGCLMPACYSSEAAHRPSAG